MRKLWLTVAVACGLGLQLPAASADPGTMASVAPLATVATPPGSANSSRMLYATTTTNDAPTVASAAVYFPQGEAPEGGWPVIAWAHVEDLGFRPDFRLLTDLQDTDFTSAAT